MTSDFFMTIRQHQEFTLSPFLSALVMDELNRDIHYQIPRCILFDDNR